MPRCLVIEHLEPERAFAVADALTESGVTVDTRRVFAGDPLPSDLNGYDGLVVMGGSMAADSDVGFPTRQAELVLLAEALGHGVPTLGICLGAQLLAVAAGGIVRRGERGPEIGWSPVTLSAAGQADRLFSNLPEILVVLQWHGDTFELPDGTPLLASNAAYANQAFRVGPLAWGLQFHLEVDLHAVEGFLATFGQEVDSVPGAGAALRAATPGALAELAPARHQLLSRFAQLVATAVPEQELVATD